MKTATVVDIYGHSSQIDTEEVKHISSVLDAYEGQQGSPLDYYVLCNGRRAANSDSTKEKHVYRILPRLPGGKGGFGSMLRAIGAQIEKTTNREACRDLSGRRMRDLNNEKKLREWVAKQAEREQEKEERRQARMERRRAEPRYTFSDPGYAQAMSSTAESTRDAVKAGLEKSNDKLSKPAGSSRKRRACETPDFDVKKASEWLGMDINLDEFRDSSDSDSDVTMTSDANSTCDVVTAPDENDKEEEQTKAQMASSSQLPIASNEKGDSNSEKIVKLSDNDKDRLVSAPQTESLADKLTESETLPCKDTTTETPPSKQEEKQSLIVVEEIESQEQLEEFGLEALKNALQVRGVKCGGGLQERAARLWSIRGLKQDQIPKALLPTTTKQRSKKQKV